MVPAPAPDQARQALAVLEDEKSRAALIATLRAIVGATAITPTLQTSTAPSKPATKSPLEPDSLGVQLFGQVTTGLENAGKQIMASARSVNDLPLLWRWLVGQVSDVNARAAILDAAWKLAVVIACSCAVEAGGRLMLRRLRDGLTRAAQMRPSPPPPPDIPQSQAADDSEPLISASRMTGPLSALRRLPFLSGRVLLDLVPIVLFAVVSNILVGTWLGEPASTRGTILLVVQWYLVARIIFVITAFLVSPTGSRQRILHISDWGAQFLSRWIRRVTLIGVTGYTIAGVGLQFNIYLTAYDTLIKLFALIVHIFVVVAILEAREPVARRIRPRRTLNGPWATVLNRLAEIWQYIAIFYVMALWLVWAVELRNGYVRLIHFFVVTAAIIIGARLLGIIILGVLDRARAIPSFATSIPGFGDRVNAYYPILRSVVIVVVFAITIVALLEAWGLGIIGWFQVNGLGGRVLSALLLITTTIFLAVVTWEGVNAAIDLHLARLSEAAQLARAGRLRTLLPMLRTTLLAAILLIVTLTTLDELGVNIGPLLAGAGVVGIAVGFGSQKLVQDLITGLFLLLENAMQVGDVVTVGGLSGTVEALSIRTIRLRALDGSVHIIPFSAVTTVTNQTRDYGYAVLDISVGLNEEPGRIVATLKEAAEEMRKEPRWQNIVLEPLDVMGIDRFVDMAWIMRVRMKTQPSSRWTVSRELNRRFKATFDKLGIESPMTSNRALSSTSAPPATHSPELQGDPA